MVDIKKKDVWWYNFLYHNSSISIFKKPTESQKLPFTCRFIISFFCGSKEKHCHFAWIGTLKSKKDYWILQYKQFWFDNIWTLRQIMHTCISCQKPIVMIIKKVKQKAKSKQTKPALSDPDNKKHLENFVWEAVHQKLLFAFVIKHHTILRIYLENTTFPNY